MLQQPQSITGKNRAQHHSPITETAVQQRQDTQPCGACAGLPRFLSGAAQSTGVNFGTLVDDEETVTAAAPAPYDQGKQAASPAAQSISEIAPVSGEGEEAHAVAFGLSLRGRTDATFSSSFSTEDVQTSRGTGCTGCGGTDCVHVTGTLVSTFSVATQVTLPSVSDFPDLTACQRQRVQNAITNVLAPHEQQHVAAFQTYNGTTRTPFDLTLCRATFNTSIQSMHDAADRARQSAARAASDALDPFVFEVDLDCTDS